MSSSTLIEVFGHIVFSFTRGVTEHYYPEEPESMAFGYDPLQGTGLEWNYQPVEEVIYQEYSEREATSLDYFMACRPKVRVINACSSDDDEESHENNSQDDEDRAMAWKRLRPSALHTAWKSMYFGASISLLTATVIGSLYILISFLLYKTVNNCEFYPKKSIPVKVQWLRSISDTMCCSIIYNSFFLVVLFLFRPYQIKGIRKKLISASCCGFLLDALYRVFLQALGMSHSKLSTIQKLPLFFLSFVSFSWQIHLVTNHFLSRQSTRQRITFFFQVAVVLVSLVILAIPVAEIIYPTFNKQTMNGKLLIALFAPLIGVVLKVTSRICVQRLHRDYIHPGYLYVLLAPLFGSSAIMFRVLQADLGSLQYIAILGIIHGIVEVIERSAMVFIDHICHSIWKRTAAPWGSFRTPRGERLMADITIMSMLFESTAIVSVNGCLYLYKFNFLQNTSLLEVLEPFTLTTCLQLVIEWFFTSVSLAIETHYQNMAVMAVWQRRWKRHTLISLTTSVLIALWTSTILLIIVHGRFKESSNQPCKMPFT
ncbi:uncharacterized protein [Pocillopora verrucosa]|uniref:uncharacterized protein n=1 Tax=Pocillopora verrucosa TaxID=203993 RepID=UPI0033421314